MRRHACNQLILHFSLTLLAHQLPAFTISAIQQRNSFQQECGSKEVTHVYVVVFVQARPWHCTIEHHLCVSCSPLHHYKVRCFYMTSHRTLCTLLEQWLGIVQIISCKRTWHSRGHGAFRFRSRFAPMSCVSIKCDNSLSADNETQMQLHLYIQYINTAISKSLLVTITSIKVLSFFFFLTLTVALR